MSNTLGSTPQLAIKEEKSEYYEEFDVKDFLNNYAALSKVNPFMKIKTKSEHNVHTSSPNDIKCFDFKTEIKLEQIKHEIKNEQEEYFEFNYDVKGSNGNIKLEESNNIKTEIKAEHHDIKVEKQEYFEFDYNVAGSNAIFKVEESVEVKDKKHENAEVTSTDKLKHKLQADAIVVEKKAKADELPKPNAVPNHDVISFSFVVRKGAALVSCSACQSNNASLNGTKISWLIHHLKNLHADRLNSSLKCEFCSTVVIDSKIVSHLKECSQIFMEIFEYENRKKYEIQKELEDQLKSEKRKNNELLKKENLKRSTIPSMCYILRGKICVTCPFCKQQGRKTLTLLVMGGGGLKDQQLTQFAITQFFQ